MKPTLRLVTLGDSDFPEKFMRMVSAESSRMGVPIIDYLDCFFDQAKKSSVDGVPLEWLDYPQFARWRDRKAQPELSSGVHADTAKALVAEGVWAGEELIGFRSAGCDCERCKDWNDRIDGIAKDIGEIGRLLVFLEKSGSVKKQEFRSHASASELTVGAALAAFLGAIAGIVVICAAMLSGVSK